MAVRQPTSQIFYHWILDTSIPAGILPPRLPSVRLGRAARSVVDMERWRVTLDDWKNSVFHSIPSAVDSDPLPAINSHECKRPFSRVQGWSKAY